MSKSLEQRIEQWEQMCQQAPDDLAWFSLGNAYKEAERHADAANAFTKALEHNPRMSRAWLNLGEALLTNGQQDEAIKALQDGYKVAKERGDFLPEKSIKEHLDALGAELPEVDDVSTKAAHIAADDPNAILDRRSGQPQTRMKNPPMRGVLGAYIQANYGQETWQEWIGMGTKVINELRLDFAIQAHQDTYEQQMLQWLAISEEDLAAFEAQQS